jgi:hypothetical protein
MLKGPPKENRALILANDMRLTPDQCQHIAGSEYRGILTPNPKISLSSVSRSSGH